MAASSRDVSASWFTAAAGVLLALTALAIVSREAGPQIETTRRLHEGRFRAAAGPTVEMLEHRLRELTGEEDALEAMHRTASATLLNDLGASYLARAKDRDDPRDLLFALEAVERAWRLEPCAETAWNRALVLERSGLRADAHAAWQHYLRLDPDSAWAPDARTRLQGLSDPSRGWSRDELHRAMQAAIRNSDDQSLRRLADEDPEQFRLVGEEVMLPDAAALLPARGERWNEVRAAARVLAGRGERLLEDTLDELERSDGRALRVTARSLDDYRRGRASMQTGDLAVAFEALTASAGALRAVENPFALRAAVFRSTVRIYDGKAAEGVQLIEESIQFVKDIERWPLAGAQMYWIQGLGLAVLGNPGPALRAYAEASRFAARTRENSTRAGLELVIADALRDIGEFREAWRHYLNAVSALDAAVRYDRKLNVLNGMVRAATLERFRLVPELVHQQVVRLARTASDPLFLTSTLIVGSRLLLDRGDVEAAENLLRDAEVAWTQVAESGMKLRVRADLDTTKYRVMDAAERVPDIEALTRSLEIFDDIDVRTRLAELHLLRGRAYVQRGDPVAARKDLLEGLAELDRHRAELTVDEKRTQAVMASALVDELLLLELRNGDVQAAFDVAETARARVLLERVTGKAGKASPALPWRVIRSRLADRTVLVAFSLLSDRLVVWRGTKDDLTAKQVPVQALKMRSVIRSLRSTIEDEDPAFLRHASHLYELLCGDALHGVDAERVVFVPDSEIFDVPFAALRGADRYLVEQFTIAVAPSASLAVLPSRDEHPRGRSLVVGVSTAIGFEPLPAVRAETLKVAARLHNSAVLLDDAATIAAFETAAPRSDVIHFAGHAIANSVRPARSAMLMSGGSALTAEHVSRMDLRAVRLVVLAACRTADGTSLAEAPVTMATAFLTSGASATVATTLDADDTSVTPLLVRFYAEHERGIAISEALRSAQLAMLRDPRFSAPRHWAPFSVIGSSVAIREH